MTVRQIDGMTKCTAVFESDRGELVMRVNEFNTNDSVILGERDEDGDVYYSNGVEYQIVSNSVWNKAGWQDNTCSYTISGQVSEEEIKEIINSIK